MCNCRDCGRPMDEQKQANSPRIGGFMIIVTCWNPDCLLHGVTRDKDAYAKLTEAELEPYRQMTLKNRGARA